MDLADYPAAPSEIRRMETAFRAYVALLDRWRGITNLISAEDFPHVFSRHVLDSLQLVTLAGDAPGWLDMGSGAGFPAIVAAIARGGPVVCVERDRRKCAFLRQVARELVLDLTVLDRSMEEVDLRQTGPVQVVSARAFAAVPDLLAYAEPWLAQGATALWPRGRTWPAEVRAIRRQEFALDVHMSGVDSQGAVFRVRKLK